MNINYSTSIITPTFQSTDNVRMILDDTHPNSIHHTGTSGGVAYHFGGESFDKLEYITYEGYCGQGGGGAIWGFNSGTIEQAIELLEKSKVSNLNHARQLQETLTRMKETRDD